MSSICKKGADSGATAPTAMLSRPDKKHLKTASSDSKLSAVIGSANLERWKHFRYKTNCQSNEEFVKVLLDLAAIYLPKSSNKCAIKEGNHDNSDEDKKQKQEKLSTLDNHGNNHSKNKKEHKHKKRKHSKGDIYENSENLKISPAKVNEHNGTTPGSETKSKDKKIKKPSIMVNISNELLAPLHVSPQSYMKKTTNNVLHIENIVKPTEKDQKHVLNNNEFSDTLVNQVKTKDKVDNKPEKSEKKKTRIKETDHDVRKAPAMSQQDNDLKEMTQTSSQFTTNVKVSAEFSNNCLMCDAEHVNDNTCPATHPRICINDSILWKSFVKLKETQDATESPQSKSSSSFAIQSLPSGLKLDDVNQPGIENKQGVFSTYLIDAFTQFGPLIAPRVKEVDVPEDCTMRYMFEVIKGETERIYYNSENDDESNWIRYLRPAATREQRNMIVVQKGDCLYFVTTRNVLTGEELVYWQDDVSGNKKKMERTICGGCNMTFQHPLQYRIHCSMFHDVRYSLTIRKYHCKVCGAAVLGTENIMKHASELHNGQGAYQCQFCKKFFLRLNYLEMHRTYGCSANPHRSRPLCDFCGKKFCQPQKLKVHIKRMHSDMSEVLKEFQCKHCMKILGSRGGLQRHFKEVHQKQIDGVGKCSCNKCGKTFQNKSNLKIHMLTHSGIKPFRCNQSNCAAAFTTKQCLQFHYKKVHGYTEDMMPKIERSVDYTFEAYSGNPDDDMTDAMMNSTDLKTDTSLSSSSSSSSSPNANMSQNDYNNKSSSISTDGGIKITQNGHNHLDDDVNDREGDSEGLKPPILHSPVPLQQSEQSPGSTSTSTSPPTLETYTPNIKILSKGSKKWIGQQQDVYHSSEMQNTIPTQTQPDDLQVTSAPSAAISAYEKPSTSSYEASKILGYNRHESNASLLVEAALDSVCSEPNIDIDVANTPCTESLVNNLYTLSSVHVHGVQDSDSLADVSYSQSVDVTDSRDINLISPSVNEQISVTDDIDELRHGQPMGMDYSSFHQEDFSPPNSPRNFRDYIQSSPQHQHNHVQHNHHQHSHQDNHNNHSAMYEKQISPGGVASPPRYDFGSGVVNPESDDSNNGIGVQNLSLHGDKFPDVTANPRDGIQLDLSIYKSHYAFDPSFLRKDSKRFEFIDVTDNGDHEHDNKNYLIDNEDTNKFSLNGNVDNDNLDSELKDFEGMEDADADVVNEDGKSGKDLDLSMRSTVTVPDLRSKFDLDLDLRKTYEMDGDIRRSYTDSMDDFRMKNYDLDNLDALRSNLERKTYESLIEDFRTDRNFEPLVLNPSELQGLDMSARGYHNYPNLNRYHHLYPEVDRPTVDLRLNYSPPPPPTAYPHPDILRVSLDLAQPTRHSVDLSLRSQIANSRLLTEHSRLGLDQGRLLPGDLSVAAPRHMPDRLISDMSNRILSDHTTNRLLGNDQLGTQRLIGNEQRMLQDDRLLEQPRLLDQNRLLGNGSMSPVSYSGYSVSPSPYHPTALPPRPHVTSPNPTPYHHYSAYY